MLGLTILICAVIVASLAPIISPYNPFEMSHPKFHPPSEDYIFGTDNLGRDLLSRIIWGTRVSLSFGMGVSLISLAIGVFLGAIAGYFGGIIDDLLSRFFEMALMIPSIYLIILVTALFGANIKLTMIIVGLTLWPSNARITRTQVLMLKNRPFVLASRGVGASHFQLLLYHILPNGMYPVIVNTTMQMGSAIMTEAALGFLGLGDPNKISWGQLLSIAQMHVSRAWWMAIFPGLAITILVLGFCLVGDGINFVMNPRLQIR